MKCAINLMGFQRFDSGTKYLVLGRSKFVIFVDALYNRILGVLWQVHQMAQGRV